MRGKSTAKRSATSSHNNGRSGSRRVGKAGGVHARTRSGSRRGALGRMAKSGPAVAAKEVAGQAGKLVVVEAERGVVKALTAGVRLVNRGLDAITHRVEALPVATTRKNPRATTRG